MEEECVDMKLYESLNNYVNKRFDEGSALAGLIAAHPALFGGAALAASSPFVYGPLAGLAAYKGGKAAWKGLRRNILQRDDPEEFNFVRGGLFTRTRGGKNKALNQRLVNNVLKPYLKKDAAGNIVFDNVKLNQLKSDDPELYNMIMKLQKDIAWGNNRSNLWMSRKHKDAIRNDLNHIEEYLSNNNENGKIMPFSSDTLRILNKDQATRSLLYKFRQAKPGSKEQKDLYSLIMKAERDLVNSRKNVKSNYMSNDFDIDHWDPRK